MSEDYVRMEDESSCTIRSNFMMSKVSDDFYSMKEEPVLTK